MTNLLKRPHTAASLTIKFKPTPAMVAAYSKALVGFVSEIGAVPDERKGELHELLWSVVMTGYDAARITDALVESFGLGVREAAEISRHQCSVARVVMENAQRLEIGIREARWLHAHAPCEDAPEHEALDGKRYSIEHGVLVNGKRTWPGWERGCKCSSAACISGFED